MTDVQVTDLHQCFALERIWQASDGQMFFGGIDGLTAFYPERITADSYHPPIVLTDLQISNKEVKTGAEPLPDPIWATKSLTLSYNQNTLSFEFAALQQLVHFLLVLSLPF